VWRFLQNPKGLTFTACKEPVNTFAREQYTVQGDGGSVMRNDYDGMENGRKNPSRECAHKRHEAVENRKDLSNCRK